MPNDFGVKDIKAYLAGANLPEELIGELATQYQEACDEAVRRLDEVIRLLTAGFRDEALGLVDQSPPLTELLAKLDFDGKDDWIVALSALGYEHPPVFGLDQISQLEEAYDDRRRLAPLLRKHRLLALGNAPISMRLAVLRLLADADPINLVWAEDIEKFELARMEEIRQEVTAALRKKDLAALARLEEELNGQWRITVPKNIREKVASTTEQLAKNSATAELKEVADQLHECLAAFDTDRGFSIRERWKHLNATAQLGPGDPTFDLANEALLWLADAEHRKEEDRQYEELLQSFEDKISREIELPIIEKFWFQIRRFDREIPKELEQRFVQYRQRVLATQSRKSRLKIAAVVAAITAAGGLLAGYLWYAAQQRELANARTQAKELANARNVAAAEAWLGKQPGWIQNDAQVAATLADLKKIWQEIQDLQAKVKENLKQVGGLLDTNGPLERDVDGLMKNTNDLLVTLTEKVGSEVPEKTEVAAVQARLDAEREKRLKDRTAVFSKQLSGISTRLKTLEEAPFDEALNRGLSEIENELKEMGVARNENKDGKPAVQANVLALIPPLEQRVKTRRKAATDYKESLSRLVEITSQIGQPEAFSRQLLSFANQYPASEWSSDFRTAAAEVELWRAFDAWKALAANPLWEQLESAKASDLAELTGKLKDLASKQPLDAFASKAKEAEELLVTLTTPGTTTVEDARKNLSQRFGSAEYLEQQVLIESETGQWKYLSEKLKDKGDYILYSAYVDSMQEKDAILRGKDARKSELSQWGWAGQRNVALKMLEILRRKDSSSPRDFGLELLKQVSSEYSTLEANPADGESSFPTTTPDPLVQLLMLLRVLDETSELSPMLTKTAREIRKIAGDFELLKNADWMNFKSTETPRLRKEAASMLAQVRELLSKSDEQAAAWTARIKSAGDWGDLGNYQWVGWGRKVGDRYELSTPEADLADQTELFQVVPGPGGKGISLKKAGTYSAGLVSGRPEAGDLKSGQLLLSISKKAGSQ
jgi:hypothetical protein